MIDSGGRAKGVVERDAVPKQNEKGKGEVVVSPKDNQDLDSVFFSFVFVYERLCICLVRTCRKKK